MFNASATEYLALAKEVRPAAGGDRDNLAANKHIRNMKRLTLYSPEGTRPQPFLIQHLRLCVSLHTAYPVSTKSLDALKDVHPKNHQQLHFQSLGPD